MPFKSGESQGLLLIYKWPSSSNDAGMNAGRAGDGEAEATF
jgi:hypothetical protein